MMSETFGPPRWSVASHGSPSKPLDLTLMSKEACWCEKGIGVCVCVRVRVCVRQRPVHAEAEGEGWMEVVCLLLVGWVGNDSRRSSGVEPSWGVRSRSSRPMYLLFSVSDH
jgi:hypothetical protein